MKFYRWCNKTDYLIVRVTFFYIYYPILFFVKLSEWKRNHLEYSDKKTKRYLDVAIPKAIAHIPVFKDVKFCHPENYFMVSNCYEFFAECFSFEDIFFRVRGKKRNYFSKFTDAAIDFFVNDYEIAGYTKTKIFDEKDWVEAKKKFPQIKDIPDRIDYFGSVIFERVVRK